MSKRKLTPSEVTEIFGYMIDNNLRLTKEGKRTISAGLEGDSGIGKTSVLEQLAISKDLDFLKLNLSQISIED